MGVLKATLLSLREERTTHGDRRRNGPRDRGFQHLSYQELMDRKQNGLCFKCKRHFSPTHQCPDKHLRTLLVGDSDTEEQDGQVFAIEVNEADDDEMGEMSLMHLDEKTNNTPQVMRFQGEIQRILGAGVGQQGSYA